MLAISLGPTLRDSRSAFCFCSSSNTCSAGTASRRFSVAVGRMASTVKVQSSWFCSKRRRRLNRIVSRIHGFGTESLTFPSRCDRRSCAGALPTASPRHTAPQGTQHPTRPLQWRSWPGYDEANGAMQLSFCERRRASAPRSEMRSAGMGNGTRPLLTT